MRLPTQVKIFIARQLNHLAVLASRITGSRGDDGLVRVRRRGARWILDLSEGIDLSIYLFGSFEGAAHDAYRRQLHDGAVVIDVGANIGSHTLPLADAVGTAGRVVAVEPTLACHRLHANVAANPSLASRIEVVQAALSADDTAAPPEGIYASWPVGGAADPTAHERHGGVLVSTDGARALTLDSLVAELGIGDIDLLKLDVDGFEMDVLTGARETLSRMKPVIVMELAPYTWIEKGVAQDAPLDLLREMGYRFADLSGNPFTPDGKGVPAIAAGRSINMLATAA